MEGSGEEVRREVRRGGYKLRAVLGAGDGGDGALQDHAIYAQAVLDQTRLNPDGETCTRSMQGAHDTIFALPGRGALRDRKGREVAEGIWLRGLGRRGARDGGNDICGRGE